MGFVVVGGGPLQLPSPTTLIHTPTLPACSEGEMPASAGWPFMNACPWTNVSFSGLRAERCAALVGELPLLAAPISSAEPAITSAALASAVPALRRLR